MAARLTTWSYIILRSLNPTSSLRPSLQPTSSLRPSLKALAFLRPYSEQPVSFCHSLACSTSHQAQYMLALSR